MEYASTVYARCQEITLLIQRAENDGEVTRGMNYYKFRTGELRTFTEIVKNAYELGSRRLSKWQEEMRMRG